MGSSVLKVSIAYEDKSDKNLFHAYAHCSVIKGKVTILFINIDEKQTFDLRLSNELATEMSVDLYHFTSTSLYSKVIYLNGTPLLLEGDDLPSINPREVNLNEEKTIHITPSSFGFLVYDCRNVDGCICRR